MRATNWPSLAVSLSLHLFYNKQVVPGSGTLLREIPGQWVRCRVNPQVVVPAGAPPAAQGNPH